MIYTVTLNPALDYHAETDTFLFAGTNRTCGEYVVPGGKGINVAVVLSRLGEEAEAIAFSAGFTGQELRRLTEEHKVRCDFIDTGEGFTRINVKLKSGEVTEFNGSGITLSEPYIRELEKRLSALNEGDTLVLSGSIPKGADPGLYRRLGEASGAGTFLVDAVGEVLLQTLPLRPFLVKPNADELTELSRLMEEENSPEGQQDQTQTVIREARRLQHRGARNVLVSMGSEGAVLVSEEGSVFRAVPPKGQMIDTVGAGDSMIAGFLHGYGLHGDYGEALRWAVAAGSATAYSEWLAERELIEELYEKTEVTRLLKDSGKPDDHGKRSGRGFGRS